MKEIGVVSIDGIIIQFKVGTESQVRFDFLDLWLEYREEIQAAKSFSFIHTHPYQEVPQPSGQDLICIEAIKAMFGRSFAFVILGLDNVYFWTNKTGMEIGDVVRYQKKLTRWEVFLLSLAEVSQWL